MTQVERNSAHQDETAVDLARDQARAGRVADQARRLGLADRLDQLRAAHRRTLRLMKLDEPGAQDPQDHNLASGPDDRTLERLTRRAGLVD
jgi:hypothetical protein